MMLRDVVQAWWTDAQRTARLPDEHIDDLIERLARHKLVDVDRFNGDTDLARKLAAVRIVLAQGDWIPPADLMIDGLQLTQEKFDDRWDRVTFTFLVSEPDR